jgi:hypothetical protein
MKTALTLLIIAFLGGNALLSLGQDLLIIKDTEAVQYVGRNVEVRGVVAVVYTSKNGNTFLQQLAFAVSFRFGLETERKRGVPPQSTIQEMTSPTAFCRG